MKTFTAIAIVACLCLPGFAQDMKQDASSLPTEAEAGTTRPPIPKTLQTLDYNINVEVYAEGLDTPWDLAFLDEDAALVTERPGRLRVIEKGHLYSKPVDNTPEVVAEGQGGLLAVAFDPDYREEDNQWIYLAYTDGLPPQPNGERSPTMTKLVRGRIYGNVWTNEQVVFEAPHDTYLKPRIHYGTRIVFDDKRNLYFSIGDCGSGASAQDLSIPNGKILRILRDGRIPKDNPFRHIKTAMDPVYVCGLRNPQGLAIHPETGQLWATDRGPLGGDELNLIQPGKNYGWPIISYGKNFTGTPITDLVRKEGMEQPVFYWAPSLGVCGIAFYHGDQFPKWNNKLLVATLKEEDLRLLDIKDGRVIHEETLLKGFGNVRDVVCGPDGAVYVVLNNPGTILRLKPKR